MAPQKLAGKPAAQLTADEQKLLKLAQLLLNDAPTTDRGLMVDSRAPLQRVRTFRADKMVDYMLDAKTPRKHGLENVNTREDAMKLCDDLLSFDKPRLFVKCTRIVKPGTTFSERSGGMRLVRLAGDPRKPPGRFELGDEARYMWVYEGDTSWNPLKLAGIVLLVIALCLFQLWPPAVRVGVWYLAVTVLLALFFTSVIQVLVLALAWLAGYELWVLPNLWSNTAMIWDLFSPVYTIEKSEGSAWYWRVGLLGVILGSGYWVASQPDELEKFMATNKQFVEDLYAGNLLSDGTGPSSGLSASSSGPAYTGPFGGSYGPGSNRYGGRQANIPRFDELEKMLQEEEELRAKDAAAQGKAQEQGEKEEHEGHDDVGKSADAEEDAPHDPEPEPDLDAMLAQDMEQEQAQEEGVQQGQEQEE